MRCWFPRSKIGSSKACSRNQPRAMPGPRSAPRSRLARCAGQHAATRWRQLLLRSRLHRCGNQAGARKLQTPFPLLDNVLSRSARPSRSSKDNRIVAWMQGRMEFGPRALGNRSILASPQDPYSTENLNTFIKHREVVRKFAASVPAELASEYFEAGPNARHLATVGRVRPQYKEQFRGAILAGDLSASTPSRRTTIRSTGSSPRLRQKDRPAGSLQHFVQPLRRAAGLYASRCRTQLLFIRDRRDGSRQFPA